MRMLKRTSWPHKITVGIVKDPDPDAVETWLGQNVGQFREHWNAVYYHAHTDYYFRNGQDAILFALRWT